MKNLIDTNYTIKPKALKKFTPIPEDKYQVEITNVTLLSDYVNPFSGQQEDRLNFEFSVLDNKTYEVPDENGKKEIESLRGRRLWKRIAPTLSPSTKRSKASWLYKLLCAVEKKELSEDELTEISPASLIGQQVMALVEISGEYNNILGFSAVTKELEPLPTESERAEKEQTPESGDAEIARVKKAFDNEEASTSNPKSKDEFIAGLEEQKEA